MFEKPKTEDPAYRRQYDGIADPVCTLEGPHCDIWSVGPIVIQFCIGQITQEDKDNVSVCDVLHSMVEPVICQYNVKSSRRPDISGLITNIIYRYFRLGLLEGRSCAL